MSVAMANTIVPKLLERDNYESWSIVMKNYLASQDLWRVTQSFFKPAGVSEREWRKKNAAALHAIHISCGEENFNKIKNDRLATTAWDHLKGINVGGEYYNSDEEPRATLEEEIPKVATANIIVPEVLHEDNYWRWSTFMKSYLVSQDLWDVVVHTPDSGISKKEWNKKNAAALRAILISCGAKKFEELYSFQSAKYVWSILQEKVREDAEGPRDELHGLFPWAGYDFLERTESLPLYYAINEGDVGTVQSKYIAIRSRLFNGPEAQHLDWTGINSLDAQYFGNWTGDSILHYATMVGKLDIVGALLEIMPPGAVHTEDLIIGTALSYAAEFGDTKIAEALVEKYPTLLSSEDGRSQEIPVVAACKLGHEELTFFLYDKTTSTSDILLRDNGKQASKLLLHCFQARRFDIMFKALKNDGRHILIDKNWKDLLDGFARTPAAFITSSGLAFWQRWIYECLRGHITPDFCADTVNQQGRPEIKLPGPLWKRASILLPFLGIKQILALAMRHAFAHESLKLICERLSELEIRSYEDSEALGKAATRAIENGTYDFLIEMNKTNADFLIAPCGVMYPLVGRKNFLMDAIAFRKEEIARFIIGLPLGKLFITLLDSDENNVLHIAGQLASNLHLSRISGAALQMQREIQWFEGVESLVGQYHKHAENSDGETAYQVFDREHKGLLKEAEDWMKGLASSYIIVGALIITIMFAAAFTLPGGHEQNTGFPIFQNKAAFEIYIIFDAISLFAATASTLIFLGFLTSRYNMEDFHKSIPKKLMAGLSTLFISLAAMMIAFCSAIFLMFENRWWITIPSVLLAGIPVSLFAWLQFPLLVEISVSTYRSPIFSEKRSLASKINAFFFGKKKIE